jgi:tetratricopeptide (TPR) repeat protein
MSRAYYYYGAHVDEDDTDLKKDLFDKGMRWGALTVKHYPDKYEGHFWYGVNCGSWGEANGVLKSLGMRHDIEREMLKVIKLGGEKYEGAGAYRVLGRLEYRLPGLFGGDNDESIKYLKKSVELAPTHTMNYLFLAETLMEEDMYEEAKKYLEIMLKMPADPQWIPEAKEDKAKGRVLLTEVLEELED